MTALLVILAVCLTIMGWTLCAILRDYVHDAAIRRRIEEIANQRPHGDAFPHTIFPVHSGGDTL